MNHTTPLLQLYSLGQSLWLDFLRRQFTESGQLQKLVDEDGLRGMTSNPSIFEHAIGGSHDYDEAIEKLARQNKSVAEIYETIVIEDVQEAAKVFRPVYDKSGGQDGFVSLEVSPYLARKAEATIEEARRLWRKLDRPNVLIKVPATVEGLVAIRRLTADGINVNVTLLFDLERYRQVADAFISGLEERVERGLPIDRIASVASFFLSRIDVAVDPILERIAREDGPRSKLAEAAHGQVAISCARVAYQDYTNIFGSERFKKLAAKGAHTQRLLWASTSTKNPEYSDVKYVDALIGPDTINTLPTKTIDAFRDHGDPQARLVTLQNEAHRVIDSLAELGVDLPQISTQKLVDEGVDKFVRAFERLMETLATRRAESLGEPLDRQKLSGGKAQTKIEARIASLDEEDFIARMWRKDPTLWTSDKNAQEQIRNALGWLHVAEKMEGHLPTLNDFAKELSEAGYSNVVHMGMGGSSLAPMVLAQAFVNLYSKSEDALKVSILDTTDPATILQFKESLPLEKTLFIAASKSGTTAETRAFCDYFYNEIDQLGAGNTGAHFATITDPGSALADLSRERNFRHTFLNYADIGGRYSALSFFGMVPARAQGIDVDALLSRAMRMAQACAPEVDTADNPAVALGAFLGELALQGRDKVTFLMPDRIRGLGMWLEQLIAESTGKEGKGLIPIADEPLGEPKNYDDDRVFVHFRIRGTNHDKMAVTAEALRKAGHPVAEIVLSDALDLGQEFLRWEIAVATAGRVLGINPFDQPNVQESKDNTNRILDEAKDRGHLQEGKPTLSESGLDFYLPTKASSGAAALDKFFGEARDGDYFALMAYLSEDERYTRRLQSMRRSVRDTLHLATTVGYGPRFLHSTGQLHKGGPNTGLFLQITCDDGVDAQVPGKWYSFGTLRKAQAQGDLEALHKHGRRAIRVHLGADVEGGLKTLEHMIQTYKPKH